MLKLGKIVNLAYARDIEHLAFFVSQMVSRRRPESAEHTRAIRVLACVGALYALVCKDPSYQALHYVRKLALLSPPEMTFRLSRPIFLFMLLFPLRF